MMTKPDPKLFTILFTLAKSPAGRVHRIDGLGREEADAVADALRQGAGMSSVRLRLAEEPDERATPLPLNQRPVRHNPDRR